MNMQYLSNSATSLDHATIDMAIDSPDHGTTTARVRFCAHDEIFDVLHVNEYTDDELERTWYQSHEYAAIHKKIHKLVLKMEQQAASGYCTRGLEKFAEQRRAEVQAVREMAYYAVSTIQDSEWNASPILDNPCHLGGGIDELCAWKIAYAYSSVSKRSHSRALAMGLQDAKAAARYSQTRSLGTDHEEVSDIAINMDTDMGMGKEHSLASPTTTCTRSSERPRPQMQRSDSLIARCA
mmetsp:Transcript_22858/g.64705  ORF Transcript_22858/g.64705 Transcript_22858/m.64705 type:complete len:238 (-) Transcript_22858:128-841(-)